MPLTRLVCYCSDCRGNRTLPVEDALRHAAERRGGQFPYELLKAMLACVQDRGTRISTTTLTTKCLRSEVLQRTEDYANDPKRMYASFRGTMFHGQLEQHATDAHTIEEPRFHIVLPGGRSFSGSPDLIDVRKGELFDYKFSKENPRFDYPWKDHVLQGQVNRWLCDNADYVEYGGDLHALTSTGVRILRDDYGLDPDDSLMDVELNREKFVPVEWQGIWVVYMDDKGPKPLLCTKSVQVPKKDGTGTKAARVADIWSDAEVEEYVITRYAEVREAFDRIGEDPSDVPPIPEDFTAWKHPLCEWCPVKDSCINHFIHDNQLERAS